MVKKTRSREDCQRCVSDVWRSIIEVAQEVRCDARAEGQLTLTCSRMREGFLFAGFSAGHDG